MTDGLSEAYEGKMWDVFCENNELRFENDELDAENAKLRELVKDFFDVPCQCLRCEHYNYEEDRCDLRDRARELGIEVTA